MSIPNWQKFTGISLYILPWSDAIPFGKNLFVQFPVLEWLALPALPLILLERAIPFGSFLLFLILFLAIIRNQKINYYIRFNTLQALLLDITIILLSYAFQILLQPLGTGLIIRTLSSTVFIAVLTIVIFTTIECLQGNEPDLPGITTAVRMQL